MVAYDRKLIIRTLREIGAELLKIAESSETFISFSWKLKLSENYHVKVRFIDSFKFLSKSLGTIVKEMEGKCAF